MRVFVMLCLLLLILSCNDAFERSLNISTLEIEHLVEDSTLNIRALDFNKDYIFYGSADHIGRHALHPQLKLDLDNFSVNNGKNHFKNIFTHENDTLQFRAIEEVDGDFLALSIENPARLYKLYRKSSSPKLVYEENHDKVFYDAMNFWNENEGIAVGDATDDCMSIIITRDGGETWHKLPCDGLPKAKAGEGAFAASDTNIAIVGDQTWVATGGKSSRILYSPNKGYSWEVFDTPIVQGTSTTGLYSIDFYDNSIGFGIGGDYTKPNDTLANKISTSDGGKTWRVVANGKGPGYRSCVQYIPNSKGRALVAVGFKGIDYSNDAGETWKHLSDEAYYTICFIDEFTAYAAGRGRISKLFFE
ncbi:oxidoreductase [Winogradskyella sp. DF17]|uniref:Oxidoreductase n=1 Tax=Winogradskyella pelagia TaxID=2819984 RepID=A0ABS3SZY8_9FLAO|nr:oxidoreductase [Winogradskyella sp. DF17]MBO3116052.1 oxidoreductase [Winogradskyella sp. DF17]